MSDFASYTASYERQAQERAKLNEANKTALFDVLEAANITEVTVSFDGEGDSGQIEDLLAWVGREHIPLQGITVVFQQFERGSEHHVVSTDYPVAEAIEDLCYDYLAETYGGWGDNDGAYGEFRFNVAERTIELEFNGRFTDTYTEHHSF